MYIIVVAHQRGYLLPRLCPRKSQPALPPNQDGSQTYISPPPLSCLLSDPITLSAKFSRTISRNIELLRHGEMIRIRNHRQFPFFHHPVHFQRLFRGTQRIPVAAPEKNWIGDFRKVSLGVHGRIPPALGCLDARFSNSPVHGSHRASNLLSTGIISLVRLSTTWSTALSNSSAKNWTSSAVNQTATPCALTSVPVSFACFTMSV